MKCLFIIIILFLSTFTYGQKKQNDKVNLFLHKLRSYMTTVNSECPFDSTFNIFLIDAHYKNKKKLCFNIDFITNVNENVLEKIQAKQYFVFGDRIVVITKKSEDIGLSKYFIIHPADSNLKEIILKTAHNFFQDGIPSFIIWEKHQKLNDCIN